ncbi:hypothetical protein DFP72DRAFT_1070604 [Ephemerocybe angulata]|uniref:Uncharacterized protein n=1 Tax=Ephemerocybe angulata TaxID=980116 RepID=A0A8H6HTV8_9AGAR|nr:hypothetical protein DFP72DRAFT_1134077 [Tulosesus angulatus]KAF6752284.1 hypothetical protein DFP72DRAFT_1070601 [Tulosesus angulatus]KAF6752287.1 hypothetical protein DFP72DRAFT_1070604 [Tulosesus angulatus]
MALQDLGKGEREMDKRWVDSPSFNIPHSPLVLFHLYLHANSQSPIHMHIRCIALRSPPLLRQFPCADRCRQRRRPSSSSHLLPRLFLHHHHRPSISFFEATGKSGDGLRMLVLTASCSLNSDHDVYDDGDGSLSSFHPDRTRLELRNEGSTQLFNNEHDPCNNSHINSDHSTHGDGEPSSSSSSSTTTQRCTQTTRVLSFRTGTASAEAITCIEHDEYHGGERPSST